MKLSKIFDINITTILISIYLMLIPLDFIPILANISISKVMAIFPIAAIILNIKNIRLNFKSYIILSLIYIILNVLSQLYSISLYDSMSTTLTITSNILLILILSCIKFSRNQVATFIKVIVISSWLILILTMLSTLGSLGDGRLYVSIFGYDQDPNYLVGYILFAIIYYFNKYLYSKLIRNLVLVIIFLLFSIYTGSRGGLIAISITLLYSYIIHIKNNTVSKISLNLIIIILLVFITINISLIIIPSELLSRYSFQAIVNSRGTGRYEIWSLIIAEYNNFPLFSKIFGIGTGTTYLVTNGFFAHNIWLDTLIGIGAAGVTVLFMYYSSLFVKSLQYKLLLLNAAFVGYLLMGLSLSLISFKPMWNVILLIMMLLNKSNTSNLNSIEISKVGR